MGAAEFEACIAAGGVAVFPSDTVYGLACDPESAAAVERMYALKGRPPGKPSAVMFFDAGLAVAALPELGERTRALMARLLPGGVTLVLPNPRGRYPLAGGEALGLRVPDVPLLRGVGRPVLQSSANAAGAPDARRIEEVPGGDPGGRRPRHRRRRAARHAVDRDRPAQLRGDRRLGDPARRRRPRADHRRSGTSVISAAPGQSS